VIDWLSTRCRAHALAADRKWWNYCRKRKQLSRACNRRVIAACDEITHTRMFYRHVTARLGLWLAATGYQWISASLCLLIQSVYTRLDSRHSLHSLWPTQPPSRRFSVGNSSHQLNCLRTVCIAANYWEKQTRRSDRCLLTCKYSSNGPSYLRASWQIYKRVTTDVVNATCECCPSQICLSVCFLQLVKVMT